MKLASASPIGRPQVGQASLAAAVRRAVRLVVALRRVAPAAVPVELRAALEPRVAPVVAQVPRVALAAVLVVQATQLVANLHNDKDG